MGKVMAPTPKCVGREFVRQYYTVLNMAPHCLYRFYSNDSVFTRGDDVNSGEPIVGQTQIFKYVKTLDLKDCRAKILLIDSQPTVSDGIVIQVSGELTSNGGPMRRFMQTFVLMPQAENKYYLHNDIFRYQDQVFEDDVEGGESVEELQHQQEQQHQMVEDTPPLMDESQQQQQHLHQHHHMVAEEHHVPAPQQMAPQPDLHTQIDMTQQEFYGHAHPQMNGTMNHHEHEALHHINVQPSEPEVPAEPQPTMEHEESVAMTPVETVAEETEVNVPEEQQIEEEPEVEQLQSSETAQIYHPEPVPSPPKEEVRVEAPAPAAPRTYAAFFKPSSAAPPNNSPYQNSAPQEAAPKVTAPPQQQDGYQQTQARDRPTNRRGGAPATNGYRRGPPPPSNHHEMAQHNETNEDDWRSDEQQSSYRRSNNSRPPKEYSQSYSQSSNSSYTSYTDLCQVFVGNLPHHVDEAAVRGIFQKFGSIADVRINTGKSKMLAGAAGGKSGSNPTPNFGFVTFHEESSVKKCLEDLPITTDDGHRLNVEEKKLRMGGGGGGFGGGGRGGMRQSGGMRGGFNRMDGGRNMRGGYSNGPPRR